MADLAMLSTIRHKMAASEPGELVRLYFHFISISIRAQLQYRASFIMMAFGHLFATGIEFAGIWALFARFGSLRGWTLPEVAIFYGVIGTAFALAEGIGRGFDTFSNLIKTGDFDRLLLRPHSTAFQVAAQEVQLMRVGRLLQATGVLVWAGISLHTVWTPPRILLLLNMVLGGTCLFYGLFVLQATLSFWTVETLEIMNTVTYGGTETAQYPLTIYRPWFRRFFTFVVPLACVNFMPMRAILPRADLAGTPLPLAWAAPIISVLFLFVSLQLWKLGVRHYTSTGS
jgi:ABC-2 type transport system permease protein